MPSLPSRNLGDSTSVDEETRTHLHEKSDDSAVIYLAEDEEFEYPEGGAWGWSTVAGAFLVQFCGFGYCTAYGVFQDYYTRVYLTESSPAVISWIGSINAFLSVASSLFTGILYDKGYFYHMLYGGSFLTAFSLFMLSLAKPNQSYQIFLAQGIGFGLGAGLTYLPSIAIVSEYFDKKQPLAMLIVVSGASAGAVVHPILLNTLFSRENFGFGNAVRASAGMVTGLCIISCLLMRSPSSGKTKFGARRQITGTATSANLWKVMVKSVRDMPFVCLSISQALFAIGFYFPIFYLQLDAIVHDVNETFSFYLFTIMNSALIVGGLVPVLFVRSIGISKMLIGSAVVTAATVWALVGLKNLASAAIITIVFGFCIGMFFGLQAPMTAILTRDQSELGARLGIMYTFVAIGALVGPPIHGVLLGSTSFNWVKPSIFSGVFATLGALGFALIPILIAKQQRRSSIEEEVPGGQAVKTMA